MDAPPRPRLRWPRPVRTPVVLQMEAVECGAAALSIVLAHYGRWQPLAELRRECGVSRDGSKASNLLRAARAHGMEAKGYSRTLEDLSQIPTPYIVFWQFNHFLVVEGVRGDRVHLNDPAVGHRTVTMQEFDEGYTGVVLVLRPGEGFRREGRRPSLIAALHRRLLGSYAAVLYCLLAGLLLTIPGILVPALSQVFLDQILLEGKESWLRPVVGAMLVLGALQCLLTLLERTTLRRFRIALGARLSASFFWHLLRLPAQFYAQRFGVEIVGRTLLNDRVAELLSGKLATSLVGAAMMVFYGVAMWIYDPVLSCIAFGAVVAQVAVLRATGRRRVEDQMRQLVAMGLVGGIAVGGLQNIESLKASGREDGFFARWAGTWTRATNTNHEISLRAARTGVLGEVIGPVASLCVLVLGGMRVIDGVLTIGGLVAFQILMAQFLEPVASLIELGESMQRLVGDLARIDDVLAHPQDTGAPAHLDPTAPHGFAARLAGRLEVRDLRFGYGPLDPPLIEGLSFSLRPGERVALVGSSGSGKSTVARLICGLYHPWSGTIEFDGEPRERIPRAVLAGSLALVDQDVVLFEGTVRDNLTLWDETVPEGHLLEALADAEILDDVKALPGGLSAALAEAGSNLSGGQRQRLEIARALVGRPRILVLDEATSALDAETERRISERLRLRGCTCVLVAHRLSTIRDCEQILVLDHGRVVERGTHEELWKAQGAYAAFLAAGEGTVAKAVT